MARFYIGQPVVCIDDRLRRAVIRLYPALKWPVRGGQYVIRANIENGGHTFVTVRGIRNRVITWPDGLRAEAGFHEDRFEPATSIEGLEEVRDTIGLFHGRADHVDEPDDHPADEPVKIKEKACSTCAD